MPVPSLTLLLMPILVPLLAGVLCLVVARLRNELSFLGAVVNLYYALRIFINSRRDVQVYDYLNVGMVNIGLRVDGLTAFVLIATAFLGLMAIIFSYRYMRKGPTTGYYYLFILFSLGCANGAFMASDLVVVLFFWGFLAALLYGLLFIGKGDSSPVAMKAFIITVTSDLLMLTGIGLLIFGLGTSQVVPLMRIPLDSPLAIIAYVLMISGALAKAGSIPYHTWIPDAAGSSPATFLGFIPGALDKLLGIYLLTRLSVYVFDIATNMALRNVLMGIGALTILAAVMMALVQKDIYRLLSFHAVSQVGYMILGIGTGTAIGIAGGLFHMLNNALYKSTLFYAAGSVEHRTGETSLDRLGGLGTKMPLTLFSFLISALAISGIPPLNGFFSKWMVYQGVLQLGQEGNRIWPVFLIAALLGSVFTLASFLKALHSIFFGQPSQHHREPPREVGLAMWLPPLLQAAACILLGVFANLIPLPLFLLPSLPADKLLVPLGGLGFWQPTIATGLIFLGIAVGLVIYLLGTTFKSIPSTPFVGGEEMNYEAARITGTQFYGPVKELGFLHRLYASAEAGAMDFYNLGIRMAEGISQFVFVYVDRTVDKFYTVVKDIIMMLGRGVQAFAVWFFVLLLVPILIFAGTGNLAAVQYMAIALMVGASLIALVEDNFTRYLVLIVLTQVGFIILAFAQGGAVGAMAGLFQTYNSAVAFACLYLAWRLLQRSYPSNRISDYKGVSEGMPVVALAFIVGGLSLSGMPPSGNFFSKYFLASIYPDNMTYTMIIIFVAMLMLAVHLRIINSAMFGKPNLVYHEERDRLYYITLAVSILCIFNGILAKPVIDLLSLVFGLSIQ